MDAAPPAAPHTAELARQAALLRTLHRPGEPLVLPNAWDAESARLVADAGFPVVATSSAAVAAGLGVADDDVMGADDAFAAVARVRRAVTVPVTADIEAGYGLGAAELVERLLGAGATGANLEDSDHRGAAALVPAEAQAERLREVRAAADAAGVGLVVNARIDVHLRRVGEPGDPLSETIRRARLYLAAGADCVYPIGVTDVAEIAAIVRAVDGPVNVLLRPTGATLDTLRRLGVARVSLGDGLHDLVMARLRQALETLRSVGHPGWPGP